MQDRTKTTYRALLASYFVLYGASIAAAYISSDNLFESVYEYRWSIHPGLRVSFDVWTGMMVAYILMLLTSLVGLFFFRAFARWLLIVALVFGHSIGHIVGLGPVVYPQFAYSLDLLAAGCIGAVLAMSFVGPMTKEFRSRAEAAVDV